MAAPALFVDPDVPLLHPLTASRAARTAAYVASLAGGAVDVAASTDASLTVDVELVGSLLVVFSDGHRPTGRPGAAGRPCPFSISQ
jgi:hypothetical protein